MKKENCIGCENDFYNGKNNLGVKECWSFEDAKIVPKIMIGHWENPPYKDKKIIKRPNCYHERGNNRTHYIDPKKVSKEGYLI